MEVITEEFIEVLRIKWKKVKRLYVQTLLYVLSEKDARK